MALIPYINDYANDTNEFGQKAEFVGVSTESANGDDSIPVVYGQRRVDGIRFFNQVLASDSTILYAAYALSEDYCQGMTQIFVDGNIVDLSPTSFQHRVPVRVSSGKYAGILEVEFVDGRNNFSNYGSLSPSPGPSALLARDLAANYNWPSLCYVVCKFTYTVGGPYKDVPKVTVDLSGRKIQPWDGTSGTVYTDNPAYVIWDLMSNQIYGRGISYSSIDATSFQQVFNSCATLRQGITPSKAVLRCNWICDNSSPLLDRIMTVLEVFQLNLSFIQNKWVLTSEHDPNSSTLTFSETNIIDEIQIQYPSVDLTYNRVIMEYPEPTNNFQPYVTQFPAVGNNTYLNDDNGLILEKRIQLNQITDSVLANDLAQMTLLRSRNQVVYRFRATKEAHVVRIGDLVTINTVLPSITSQSAIVISQRRNPDYTFDMECVSYNASWYPKSFTNTVPTPVASGTVTQTPLPPPVVVPTTSYSITSSIDVNNFVFSEGTNITWTVKSVNVPDGTVILWKITTGDGYVIASDFVTSPSMEGTLTINSSTATLTRNTYANPARSGSRKVIFTISNSSGVQLAQHSSTLIDAGTVAAVTNYRYTFASAIPLSDNINWYLGYTKADNTFDADTTLSASLSPSQMGFYSAVNNIGGCIIYEIGLGLIDRITENQALNKQIFCVYSSGTIGGNPAPYGYQRFDPRYPTNNIVGEGWEYDPENPPLAKAGNPLLPWNSTLTSGSRYQSGSRLNEDLTLAANDFSAGTIKFTKVRPADGAYMSNQLIRINLQKPSSSPGRLNGNWYNQQGSFFNRIGWDTNNSSGALGSVINITFKFFEVNKNLTNPIIYIGKRTLSFNLNASYLSKISINSSRTNWASLGWTATF